MYIIIWKHNRRDPHVDVDDNEFIEYYSTEEEAMAAAEKIMDEQGDSIWYYNYKIFQEIND